MKDPLNRTKVVLRRLPPSVPQQAIMDQIDARFSGRYDWVQFRQGKSSAKHQRYTRVYLNFVSSQDVVDFAEFFNGRSFVNEKGAQFKAVVEYAPSQRVPKASSKKDGREGTIDKDPDYIQFLEQIAKPVENLPSAEIQLERKEAEKAAAGKEPPVVTALMDFIRQKRAAKNGPPRSSAGSGRVPSSRKSVSIISSSPSSSSKRSDRRRVSSSTYVVKEASKEKPMYILASRREEHTNKDKDVIISASKHSDTPGNDNATSSGAIAGSSMAVEAGKGKIILLKSRGKESSQDNDVSASQQNNVPPRSSQVQTSKNEHSGRIIRGILSNKDLRPSRGSHIRSDSDDRIPMDDRYGMTNTPGAEKERSNRSRDRPVWPPQRYAERSQNVSDSVDRGASLSHNVPVHGERKADIVGVRREEMRGHGNSRGNVSSMENGLQRHGNRRGPPRGPKEVESSMGISEGKHSKRGPSGYNAHEKQVWVQKTGSAS